MFRKSGHRFSDKNMRQRKKAEHISKMREIHPDCDALARK